MTPQQIQQKLSKGDEVRFKNGLTLYYVGPYNGDNTKGWFKETHGSTNQPKYYRNIVAIKGKPINEQKMEFKKLLKEELENAIQSQKKETLTFESDPIEYIIQRYPSLDATMIDLMTNTYRDYLTGIYVMAPKPTTFKILLHNGQSFYLIYNPKAYIAKISGKQYHLMSLKDEEYAVKAISRLLLMGIPPSAPGPDGEVENEADGKNDFISDMTSEPDLGLDGIDASPETEPGEEPTEEPEDELQEQEEPKKKIPTRFRIVKNK